MKVADKMWYEVGRHGDSKRESSDPKGDIYLVDRGTVGCRRTRCNGRNREGTG